MLLWKLAFRNVFRNRRRTLLTVLLIGFGLASMMATDSIIEGMKINMIRTATETFFGHAQIHHPEFRRSQAIEDFIQKPNQVIKILKSTPEIEAYSPRTVVTGMLSSPTEVSPVQVYGVIPLKEVEVTKIKQAIVEGHFLDANSELDLVIGKKLAEDLGLAVGDRVVLTAAQAYTGELGQELFRVSGVFSFHTDALDQSIAFVNQSKLQRLIGLASQTEPALHEVAIKYHSLKESSLKFSDQQMIEGNEWLSWKKIVPSLDAMLEMSQFSILIIGLILFAIVAVSVVNSILMSIYERMFEFGVIRAIGTRGSQVFKMMMMETTLLGLLSIFAGLGFGCGVILIGSRIGIDYRDLSFGGVTFQEPIYLQWTLAQFTWIPAVVFLITLLSGIYPAMHAARIVPSQAMRKSF